MRCVLRLGGLALTLALALALAWLALVPAAASAAEGLALSYEPGYSWQETDLTDQTGNATHYSSQYLIQNARLTLDRSLTQRLDLTLGATFLDRRSLDTGAHQLAEPHEQSRSLFGRLTFGTPAVSWGIGADLRDERARGTALQVLSQNYTAYALWRPLLLPELDARVSRVIAHDENRTVRDTTIDTAAFGARLNTGDLDLRYRVNWTQAEDHLYDSTSTSVDQYALASWSGTTLWGRTSFYVTGTGSSQNAFTDVRGVGGTVAQQRFPTAGYSAVLTPPATPLDVELKPNPALVDGNLNVSASVNLGFGRSAAGDTDAREVGGSFADLVNEINTLYVWLDRSLTPDLYAALGATAQVYQSDDNHTWTAVTLTPAVTSSPFENRLEFAIPRLAARYLKVELRPLEVAVTTDPAYRDVYVTEVQFLLVLPADQVPRRQESVSGSLKGYGRTVLLRGPELAWDITGSLSGSTVQDGTQYLLGNGLTLSHPLLRTVTGTARGARIDQDLGRGHEAYWEWSAALTGRPVPTAIWSLTYSGRDHVTEQVSHALTAFGRADWYPGISSQLSATGSVVAADQGARTATAFQGNGSVSMTPNRWVSLTVGGLYDWTVIKDITRSDQTSEFARLDGSMTLTPAPALTIGGTLSRIIIGERPSTLGSMQLSWFPLRGEFQLSLDYSNTLDTAAQATTSQLQPEFRWNLRRGVSITANYTWLRSDSPVQTLRSKAFLTTLLIIL